MFFSGFKGTVMILESPYLWTTLKLFSKLVFTYAFYHIRYVIYFVIWLHKLKLRTHIPLINCINSFSGCLLCWNWNNSNCNKLGHGRIDQKSRGYERGTRRGTAITRIQNVVFMYLYKFNLLLVIIYILILIYKL